MYLLLRTLPVPNIIKLNIVIDRLVSISIRIVTIDSAHSIIERFSIARPNDTVTDITDLPLNSSLGNVINTA